MLKSFLEWLRAFKRVEREGTPDQWATGFNITFIDEFGTQWHMSASKDPKHWYEQSVNKDQIIYTRNQVIKKLRRIC